MTSFTTFLIVYLFGGLTFIPLLLAAAVYFLTRPAFPEQIASPSSGTPTDSTKQKGGSILQGDYNYDGLVLPGDDVKTLESVRREHAQDRAAEGRGSGSSAGLKKHRHDRTDDVATAGYFAVHRKYVAMGVNSKPIEPGSSVGPAAVAPPSPSVYQTFFRNMLNKKPGPDAVEIGNAASPRPRNARNMFYVVLRHGHLILFDDDQQVDVRHVIKLADHDVGIYSGRNVTPEGELFIKRNAVHLSPKNLERAKAHNAPTPQPWFFYSENCSEKEDFYFSLLRCQENAPQPHEIDVRHLTALMERLHASEEAAEMRWLNAFIGRLFLGVYKTDDVLKFVQSKIITKLSRTPRPNFISSLVVQRVDIGETTPQITSPRLKSLTAEGECIVEADVRYTGRFEIDVSATIRVSMPIGQQEVKTSLAVVLTQIEGHMLFKIKAPPSNRIWFSFRHMPKIEMEIRPIVMARQLTWPVFIQMIEGKIKEAIAESIVLPFWDDTPFFSTERKPWRGGLWEDSTSKEQEDTALRTEAAGSDPHDASSGADTRTASSTGVAHDTQAEDENVSPAVLRLRRLSKVHSAPISTSANTAGTVANDKGQSPVKNMNKKQHSSNESVESNARMSPPSRFARTASALATPSEPIVGTDRAHAEAAIPFTSPPKGSKQASAAMSWLSSGTLRSRRSSVSSSESVGPNNPAATAAALSADATSRHRNGPESNANDDGEGNVPFFPASDSETLDGEPTLPSSTRTGSDWDSVESRSFASRSTRASSSSLAGTAKSGTSPSLSRKKSVDSSVTTTMTHDADTAPAKRSAVLAAAMTGAAQSAKRWGINALQRRAAAAAERKARPSFDHRTSTGEPLDLSKPIGGGRPLPPPGEPLPRPSELAVANENSLTANPLAKPMPTARRSATDVSLRDGNAMRPVHEQKIRRKQIQPQSRPTPTHRSGHSQHDEYLSNENIRRRRQGTSTSSARGSIPDVGQQDMFVIAAPIDSDSEESDKEETLAGHGEHNDHDSQKLDDLDESHGPPEEPSAATNESLVADHDAPELQGHESAAESMIEDHSDGQQGQLTPPEIDSIGQKSEVGGRESPVADEDEVGDAGDAQWGEVAESVGSAFLDKESEAQTTARGGESQAGGEYEDQAADEHLISFDDANNPHEEGPPLPRQKDGAALSV